MFKVCFISPEYAPVSGGTGAYVHYLSRALIGRGNRVYIVTGNAENKEVKIDGHGRVFFLKTLNRPGIRSLFFFASTLKRLKGINARFNIDIAHANLPLIPSFTIPQDFGNTLISTVHSTWKGEAEAIRHKPFSRLNPNEKLMVTFNPLLRVFESKLLRRSEKIIAVSEYTKRELLKHYKVKRRKIQVVHNGVNTQKFRPPKDKSEIKKQMGFKKKDRIVLYVGRLYSRKGLYTLIKAIPRVTRKHKDVNFVIAGEGLHNEREKLAHFAAKLGVKENTIFTGYFPDEKLPKLYQASDIFLFPTLYENLPFAVLEALSTGLPVVTTRVGGIPEVITNGKNGFLVETSNPEELADRTSSLLEDPRKASKMGRKGRKVVEEKFDWRHIVEEVVEIYSEALG